MTVAPTPLAPWIRTRGPEVRFRTGPVAAAVSTWENASIDHRLEALQIVTNDWCNVVAVTPDDHVVLVRQFRFGIAGFSIETPGGVVDDGETPEAAAVRELFEETGYRGDAPVRLSRVHANPALQANVAHGFLVQNARFVGEHRADEGEDLEVVRVPAAEILAMITDGRIHHALIVVTLQAWLFSRAARP
jgi:8-oxo-dGTP pyrophosphatase MutT (NUDIX family)